MPDDMSARLRTAVIEGDAAQAADLARLALEQGASVSACVDDGLVPGIEEVGRLWEAGEYFLPELMQGAEAMKAAMAVLQPALLRSGTIESRGARIVMGTVRGDIHDIGKTLVATFLEANGFAVVDLGRDVPLVDFVDAAEREGAALIGLSALLTTTMPGQAEVVGLVRDRGLADRLKVMVGGAPVTRAYAVEIGASGFAANAVGAVAEALRLSGGRS